MARADVAPRGIRNHNPGNLRHGAKWQGRRADQTDAAFVQFVSPEYGIRALAKVLLTYYAGYELDTVTEIIGRWAPPNENDTGAYVRAVAKAIGVGVNDPLIVAQRHVMAPLVKAIIQHENGRQPYSDELINRGLDMAGMPI